MVKCGERGCPPRSNICFKTFRPTPIFCSGGLSILFVSELKRDQLSTFLKRIQTTAFPGFSGSELSWSTFPTSQKRITTYGNILRSCVSALLRFRAPARLRLCASARLSFCVPARLRCCAPALLRSLPRSCCSLALLRLALLRSCVPALQLSCASGLLRSCAIALRTPSICCVRMT